MTEHALNPPRWVERVLLAILPMDRAESISGDLLESYRDEQVPRRGQRAADRWFLKQVLLIFGHTYGLWLAALICLFVLGDVSNTYQSGRPSVGPWLALVLVLGVSAHGGWHTERWRGGLLIGAASVALLWLFMASWWMTTWYPFALVQQTEPYWINAWHSSATTGESFLHWIFWDNVGAAVMSGLALSIVGLASGVLGGFAGATARRITARA